MATQRPPMTISIPANIESDPMNGSVERPASLVETSTESEDSEEELLQQVEATIEKRRLSGVFRDSDLARDSFVNRLAALASVGGSSFRVR